MYKSFTMELAGRPLTVDVGRVAKQANGAAFMHYGDTTCAYLLQLHPISQEMELTSSRSA